MHTKTADSVVILNNVLLAHRDGQAEAGNDGVYYTGENNQKKIYKIGTQELRCGIEKRMCELHTLTIHARTHETHRNEWVNISYDTKSEK